MMEIELRPVSNFCDIEGRWRALERYADASFFQSWTFLGCLAEERFSKALLLSVRNEDGDAALALIGVAGKWGFFNQTGKAEHDAVFIEHNALLTRSGAAHVTVAALRYALRQVPTISLPGVTHAMLHAAGKAGWVRLRQERAAPFVVLNRHKDPLADVSSNLKMQIRRSQRLYGADVALSRAQSLEQALDYFGELVTAHQVAWQARGKPGAFASLEVQRFHEALIRRAWAQGEVDLLRVAAGPRLIGTLYNFVKGGRVSAYQSGLVYSTDNREKPGLLCHALALHHYARQGLAIYDFLAGADRYKLSFTKASEPLYWADLYRRWSLKAAWSATRQAMAQLPLVTRSICKNAAIGSSDP